MSKQTHLKSIKNGRVFLFSTTLATRDDMIPCDAQGNIASGHVGDATAIDATQTRRVTKFLGNVKNGVLYPYTKILAERDDMVSIDTEEQWKSMRETGRAPEVAPDTLQPKLDKTADSAPALGREPKKSASPTKPAKTKEPVTKTSDQGQNTEYSLPVIEGMGAREAKTVLSAWAKEKFGKEIDRRPKLDVVIDECRMLSMQAMDKAVGQ